MKLTQILAAVCKHLSLKVHMEFNIQAKDGTKLKALCLIPDFGGDKGTLVFTNPDIALEYGSDIIEQGYGYTTLSNESIDRGSLAENLSTYVEMFQDWGWTGKATNRPVWMHPKNHDK